MVELKEKRIKSKKTGKEYTACVITIGEYETPIFFPSDIEKKYILDQLNEQ